MRHAKDMVQTCLPHYYGDSSRTIYVTSKIYETSKAGDKLSSTYCYYIYGPGRVQAIFLCKLRVNVSTKFVPMLFYPIWRKLLPLHMWLRKVNKPYSGNWGTYYVKGLFCFTEKLLGLYRAQM